MQLLLLYRFLSVCHSIILGLVTHFGSLVVLVLGGMDQGMRQQLESSGLLTSSHTHTPCTHNSLSGVNKESASTYYTA